MNKSNMLERDGEFDDNDGSTSTAPKKMKLGRENNGKRKLTHDAYTVGWVCVLRSELNASRALLDEEHERLPLAEKDDNSYLLGRMGEHDVVIAFPGSGTYGTNAAAQTATNLIRTFRNIRFGLMVGIGGGAPKRPDPNDPRNDIRLGDIVVSTPKGGHGGVLQYDAGKWKDKGEFHIQSHLNKPPKILSKAIELLQSDHDFGEGKMEDYIKGVAIKSSKLPALRDYRFPGRDQDLLFRLDYHHASGEDCLACDPMQVEKRLDRESDNPVVHYGLIASGNAVLRSAQRRNELRDEWGILCFEMEAAGLMDDFPCVVIRGICDYSDDHKHKLWQPYSAVVAAAYAKDILRVVQPQEVKNTEAAAEVVKQLQQVQKQVQETYSGVENLRREQEYKTENNILNWLSQIDFSLQQTDLIQRREAGTGQWLLKSAEYQTWLTTEKQTLFCPGIPGAGKTIITAIVIDDLYTRFQHDTGIGIAYLFCDFRRQHEQQIESLLANLVKQLAQKQTSMPTTVKCLFDQYEGKPKRPSFDEISKALHLVTSLYSKAFIIIDALDECQVTDGCRRRLLFEIFNLQASKRVNIFSTSRFIPEILETFKESVSLEIRASDEDVQSYLTGHMTQLPSFVLGRHDLQNEIKATISKAVAGMFLLAPLYMDSLAQEPTVGHIEVALQSLPTGLDEIYEQAMLRIEKQGEGFRKLAKKVLSWVVHAKRVLSTAELQHAVAVEPGKRELNRTFIPDIEIIGSICAGLVTVDTHSDVIRLVHYTAQEYFEGTQGIWFPNAETDITRICVTYLSFYVFDSGFCQTEAKFKARLRLYRLYDYAAQNWGHHARVASAEVEQLVMDLLESEAKVSGSSQAMMASGGEYFAHNITNPPKMTGLHLAAYFGLSKAMIALLKHGYEQDSEDSYGRTALSHAAGKGYEAVVKLLLAKDGVDLNSKDWFARTALSRAARDGHEAVVKLLLAKDGVDLNSKDWSDLTALSHAAEKGHEAVVKLLLAKDGADVNSKDSHNGRTALLRAAEKGHEAVVKLLLAKDGVDLNSKDSYYGQTALSRAAEMGHEAVVKLLLAKDKIDLNSKSRYYGQTALSHAAEKGHEAVVKLLLAKDGVDLNSKDKDSQTTLSHAAGKGYEAVVKLLLAKDGVDLNSKDSHYGQTALLRAAEKGYEAVVKLLLAKDGVDLNSRDRLYGQTALSHAAAKGHEAVVKLLLAKDRVDPNSKDGLGRTALSHATEKGHEAVVKLLLAKDGVDLNSKDGSGWSALSHAAEKGHEAVVKLLLAKDGVDLNSKGQLGRTALSHAAEKGYEAVVKLLLAKDGVDLNSKDGSGWTALSHAAEKGYEAVVKLLLGKDDVDLNSKDWFERTALSHAAGKGHEAVVKLLLATDGVDLNSRDRYYGQTALSRAAVTGHEAVVKLLLAKDGVDLNSKDWSHWTALSRATGNDHEGW